MFKKTLLAASFAALSTGAMAVDVDNAGSLTYTYGAEALNNGQTKNDFTAVTLNAVRLDLGAAYSVGDVIKVNLSGATFKTTGETYALVSSDGAVIAAGFLSATANQLVFRVTTAAAGTAAETLTLAAGSKIKLDSTAVGAKVTVSASAETSTGITIDVQGTKDSKVVGTVIQQHKFTITTANKLNEKIDVADKRERLAGVLSDTATLTYDNTTPSFAATDFDVTGANELKVKVNGSYTGFEKGLTGSTNVGVITVDGTDSTVAADLQSGSVSLTRPAVDDTLPLVFTPDAATATRKVLSVSAYTVDVELNDGSNSTKYNAIAAGSLVLNGSSAQYAYVPVNYNGAVTTNFEIGNSGVVDGEITLTAFDTAGKKYSATLDYKAEAGKLTKVSDADITKAFALTTGTKLNLTITVNSPNANITYGAYSNRGTTGRMAINKV